MTTTFVAHHDQVWSAIGGELAVYYESVGDVDWGFAKDIYQLNTPKMAALNQLFAANRAEPAIWNTPPVTLYGSEVDIANKAPTNTVRSAMILSYSSDDGYPYNAGTYGTATAVHMKKREYAFYGVRTTADGALAVTVSASVNTGGSLSVRLDGVPLGTVLPSNKAPVVFNIASVTKGLHTVAVVSSGADADLLSVAFQ